MLALLPTYLPRGTGACLGGGPHPRVIILHDVPISQDPNHLLRNFGVPSRTWAFQLADLKKGWRARIQWGESSNERGGINARGWLEILLPGTGELTGNTPSFHGGRRLTLESPEGPRKPHPAPPLRPGLGPAQELEETKPQTHLT